MSHSGLNHLFPQTVCVKVSTHPTLSAECPWPYPGVILAVHALFIGLENKNKVRAKVMTYMSLRSVLTLRVFMRKCFMYFLLLFLSVSLLQNRIFGLRDNE